MNLEPPQGIKPRATLELLEPMEPHVSDNVLNGAKRLNGLNDLNAPAPSLSAIYKSMMDECRD